MKKVNRGGIEGVCESSFPLVFLYVAVLTVFSPKFTENYDVRLGMAFA